MNYEKMKASAENYMESPIFTGISPSFKDGMVQGFINGAMWAQKERHNEFQEQCFDQIKTLLQQAETLIEDIEQLKRLKSLALEN